MEKINRDLQVFSNLRIDITFADLEKKIRTNGKSPAIQKIALDTFNEVAGKWEPAALYQWYSFEIDSDTGFGYVKKNNGEMVQLELGASASYLENARSVMVVCYTVGETLDAEAAEATSKGGLLESYIIDLMGLTALDKAGDFVRKKAEEQAKRMEWGVGPFLSPGSVHGWALQEQIKLSELLPLETINMRIRQNAFLYPLKSVFAVIGIGPGYESCEVGSTCNVCNKRNNCLMRRDQV